MLIAIKEKLANTSETTKSLSQNYLSKDDYAARELY